MTGIGTVAVTHGGKFHADDVFGAALLKILKPEIRIQRVFQVPENFDGLVFDIGGGRFDHHQEGAEVRENGVPYAAFGLLWREFGAEALRDSCPPEAVAEEVARFDENLIQSLDEDDNTGGGNPLAGAISLFNPDWDSEKPADDCFAEAVEFAKTVLTKKIARIAANYRAKGLVEAALAESRDRIVILPRYAPWRPVLEASEAEFVVYPSQRGGYSAQTVPDAENKRESKCDFPEEWAAKPENELPGISGIGTLRFCHKGRFLITAGTQEDAVEACRAAQRAAAGARGKTESDRE